MPRILAGSVFFVLSIITTVSYGQIWDETIDGGGDAGDFPTGSFQGSSTGSSFDFITGELGGNESDAYLITIDSPTWSASVVDGLQPDGQTTDTRSWLFDTDGNFLMFNEDIAPDVYSHVSDLNSFPGTGLINNPMEPAVGDQVVLVINGFDDNAVDTNGGLIVDFINNGFAFQALHGVDEFSNGTFSNWSYDNQNPVSGSYSIQLTGASFRGVSAVPEPSSFTMIAVVAIGIGSRRRRRK